MAIAIWKCAPVKLPYYPEGAAPWNVLLPEDLLKANFPDSPEIFPLFFRLSDENSEDDEAKSCPWVNSEHILA